MKILLTTRTGAEPWSFAVELLRQLGALGCEMEVAVLDELDETQRIEAERLTNVALHAAPVRAETESGGRDGVGAWLESVVEETRPDLLHLNDYAAAERRWGVPVLLVAHARPDCGGPPVPPAGLPDRARAWDAAAGVAPRGTARDRRAQSVRARTLVALDRADGIVATTEAALAELLAAYPEADVDGRERVIRCGIDPRHWPAGQHGNRCVLAAGSLAHEAGNLHALLDAAPSLDCPVVVLGEQPRGAGRTVRNLVLPGRVSRAGFGGYCRSAAVFACPAYEAPFVCHVLEAAASGCALVLANIAPLRELWDGAALFVDPGRPADLRAALRRLLEDPGESRAWGEAARVRALRYGARKMALAYIEAYASLLDHCTGPEGLLTQGAA